MKKFNLLIFICIILFVTGCSNGQTEFSEAKFSEGLISVNDVFVEGMIMVNDGIYIYTGYEVPAEIKKSNILGKITSTVDYFETPSKNGQANFKIKGTKYAQYADDIVVSIDNEWILFKNKENMIISGISVGNFEFLMSNLSDEEMHKVFRTIRKYIIVDEDYENNLDSIIEKSFNECGIYDSSIIDYAISNLEITVSKLQNK